MSGVMERTLALLERLAGDVNGLPLATLADELDIPRSAAHRLLGELAQHGYVRQSRERGHYMLTTRLVSLGLAYLKASGVADLCQPVLDRLARTSGELVRLGVVDVDHITWVAMAQGARWGLRYDPDQEFEAPLSSTSSGIAWLATLDEDDAIALVMRQGLASREHYGPGAPASIQALMKLVRQARKQGWVFTYETYGAGINAMAAPIVPAGKGAVGVLTMFGPAVRLTEDKLREQLPGLLAAAREIAEVSAASPLFDRAYSQLERQEKMETAT